MKNIIKISTLAILVLFTSVSCQDELERLYQNPDGFSKEQADNAGVSIIAGYFTAQCTRGFFLRGDYGSQYHLLRSGNRIMGNGIQLFYAHSPYGLSYTLRDVEHDWGTNAFNHSVFNKINADWIKQVLWGQKEYNKIPEGEASTMDDLFMKLLHILKAYGYQRAIDLYDEVPYFETGSAGALEGDRAVYLGQKEIYPILIAELKEADEYIAGLTLTDSEQTLLTNQDVIFNGDLLQWRKYINSLRLRCAMNVSEVTPDVTQTVISELNGKPLFDEYDDVAGLADIAIVDPNLIQKQLGITRAFREVSWTQHANAKFLHEVMHCVPDEKSVVVNGETLYYFDGDNVAEGLLDGTVDPRITYLYSANIRGHYFGSQIQWDHGTDPNSYFSKIMRGYYIDDPILTDISVHSIIFGKNDEHTINLNDETKADLTLREAFLRDKFHSYVANFVDTDWFNGVDANMVSEHNVRPLFNFDIRFPTLHAVETELSLAEAGVRGFGTLNGTAREHYKNAVELSCTYWYNINAGNQYSRQTVPAYPSYMDDSRIDRDRPEMEYDAAAYAETEAQNFDAMSDQEKVQAIFNQLQVHYNLFNWETPYTAARRLIKYLGTNPATPFDTFEWKERMSYPGGIQASDPENWAKISVHNDVNLPVWLTGRTEKWKNVLE